MPGEERGWGRCHMRMVLSFVGGPFGLDRMYDGKIWSAIGKLLLDWIGLLLLVIGLAVDEVGLTIVGALLMVTWFIWYVFDLYHYTFLAGKESRGNS
jgi:hypothetical protein